MPNDIPNSTWNESDASNTAPVPNGAPEGWFPSDVNNVYRMGMGATKRFWDHLNVTQTTTGTNTAYELTYAVAPQQYWNGESFSFIIDQDCGAAPTLNVNALGPKALRKFVGGAWVALEAADLLAEQVATAHYDQTADKIYITNRSSADAASLTADNDFTGKNTFGDTVTMDGAAFNGAERVDVASATTTDIGAAVSNYVNITGTVTITGLGTIGSGAWRHALFADILTLTHSAALVLPFNGKNIVTAAGDTALFISDGSGNWRCLHYQRARGTTVATVVQQIVKSLSSTATLTGTYSTSSGAAPTSSGGVSVTTQAITPASSGSTIEVEAIIKGTPGGGDHFMGAVFQGTTLVALEGLSLASGTGVIGSIRIRAWVTGLTAGTPVTFDLRLGSLLGNSWLLNTANTGSGAVQQTGSVSYLTLTEIVSP